MMWEMQLHLESDSDHPDARQPKVGFIAFVPTRTTRAPARLSEVRFGNGGEEHGGGAHPKASTSKSGIGPWLGARVAPQHCPILRPGQGYSNNVMEKNATMISKRGHF